MLASNSNIIKFRWPCLHELLIKSEKAVSELRISTVDDGREKTITINDIHISSVYDRLHEATIQSSLIPDSAKKAHVYGPGLGDVVRILLMRDALKEINVYPLNVEIFRHVLCEFDCSDWLEDERVRLVMHSDEHQINTPFSAVPACLAFADRDSRVIADKVILELSTPYMHEQYRRNEDRYRIRIQENMPFIEMDSDVDVLENFLSGKDVVVSGAGPTLELHYEWLRQKRTDISIISVDTALKPLLRNGIYPDFVVSIDGADEVLELFEIERLHELTNCSLVYFPVIHRKIIEKWPGKRFVAYSIHETYRMLSSKYPRGKLFASGSVIHSATDLAVKCGAKNIYFVGVDFSYVNGTTHANGSSYSKPVQSDMKDWVLNGHGNKVATAPNLRGFLRDLESFIKRHKTVRFFNTCLEGAKIEGAEYRVM